MLFCKIKESLVDLFCHLNKRACRLLEHSFLHENLLLFSMVLSSIYLNGEKVLDAEQALIVGVAAAAREPLRDDELERECVLACF